MVTQQFSGCNTVACTSCTNSMTPLLPTVDPSRASFHSSKLLHTIQALLPTAQPCCTPCHHSTAPHIERAFSTSTAAVLARLEQHSPPTGGCLQTCHLAAFLLLQLQCCCCCGCWNWSRALHDLWPMPLKSWLLGAVPHYSCCLPPATLCSTKGPI